MRENTKTSKKKEQNSNYNKISSMTVSNGGTGTPGVGIEPAGGSNTA